MLAASPVADDCGRRRVSDVRLDRCQAASPDSRAPRGRAGTHLREAVSERKMIMERLLSVAEAADRLGTTARFPRRLIAERRIRFVRVGRHIRIPESAIGEFIAAGTVQPITWADVS